MRVASDESQIDDIENSTPLNERLGDARYMELPVAHNAIIEAQVSAHNGYVVKTMGDGYMVALRAPPMGCAARSPSRKRFAGMEDGVRVRGRACTTVSPAAIRLGGLALAP